MGAKDDKKKDASKNKDDKKKISESVAVVLKIDLHCEGCARKVKNSICKFKGVESVNVDMASNKVTVMGKVNPVEVKERIEKKTKKKVEIEVKKDQKKSDEKSPENKSDDKKADVKKSGEKGNKGGDVEKKKDGDKDKKNDEVKADASKNVVVAKKMEYYGQNYPMPMYNQSYYNQDYGILTSNHGYANMGYANHGYPIKDEARTQYDWVHNFFNQNII